MFNQRWQGPAGTPAGPDLDQPTERRAASGVMERLPIRTRLMVLSGVLLVFLFTTNSYLNHKLAENSAGMTKAVSALSVIRDANDAQVAYGEFRYWLTDLAVSSQSSAGQQAAADREQMERELDRLAQRRPYAVAELRRDLARFEDFAGQAVEEYTSGNREAGNSLLAKASDYGIAVERRLAAISGALTQASIAEREQLITAAMTAKRLSRIIVWTAVLVGTLLTLLVLRSIVGPLRRLVVAMNGLNAGDVAVAIPAAGPDEIGAMARTLAAFRETLKALRSALAQFEALRDVGRAVGSTLDPNAVLDLVVARAVEFSQAQAGVVYDYDETTHEFTFRTSCGAGPAMVTLLQDRSIGFDKGAIGRSAATASSVQVPDLLDEREAAVAELSDTLGQSGYRSLLAVPLLHEQRILGGLVVLRQAAGTFSQEIVGLIEAFAAQSALAVRNAMLFEERFRRERELRAANEQLRAAQASLIQAEKMASLGQLTAGIAHEIKNPLNFVNNFAELSRELLDELREALGSATTGCERGEIDELIATLSGNLAKIGDHGRRADGIVRSMLLHSRSGGGERRPTDLNALAEEALGLAYHGARAQDPAFNITIRRKFAPDLGLVELVPQDITRVLLNLYANSFYATNKRLRAGVDPSFDPVLEVITQGRGDEVEITIHDNGVGMTREVRERLFTPFFTTKPTGEGTGLGLSISYDIIVQGHGGTITVDSRPNEFTEFILRLPRVWRGAAADATAGTPS
jgi:signal transduction histidine kinase/HAMP domain-containing protein